MTSSPTPFLIILLYFFFLILSPWLTNSFNMANSSSSYKVKLMHIDHPDSPYRRTYNSMEHKYQVWEEMSLRRFAQIFHDQKDDKDQNVYHPEFYFDPIGLFMARMGIGQPPQEQFFIVDTGSTITWANGSLTENYQRMDYSFPQSNSVEKVLCSDEQCQWIPSLYRRCSSDDDPCKFTFSYASVEQLIHGNLLLDTFSFNDQRQTLFATSIAFGCARLKSPLYEGFIGSGVLGLSNDRASLASQLGPSFSYCITNMYDVNSPHNSLTLGRGDMVGTSTPILDNNNRIYVNIESINVGGETLKLDPYMFRRYDYIGGTALDTGSTTTYLLDEAYHAVRDKLAEKMKPESSDAFCFRYIAPHRVPVVQLVFEGGAILSLGAEALFGSLDPSLQAYCFRGIKPSSAAFDEDSVSQFMSVIGINAQQHHNIGIDLKNSLMYVQESWCDYKD